MASRAPAHADVERVGGVGEVPCLLHVGFGLFFGLFAFVFGQPLVKPCLEPVGERLFRPDGLRGFLRRLLALNYMFEDSGKIIQFALFTKFVTDPQEATLAVGVNEEFAFLLNDLTSQFTRFELAEFADLKSKYAKEFYRRAKQYRSSGIWKISRDEFCRLLSVPKSTAEQVRDLNKRVLKPIIEECGPLLGLKIERQYVKRRLSGFVFTFARETPPVIDARPVEARKAEDAGHWTSVAGYGEVFTTTELFDVTAARDHFDGTVEAGECRFCAFDARNREHHAQNAGKLF